MKNYWIKTLLAALVCVLAVVAVKELPCLLRGGDESEVYKHYVGRPDLKVGFVKDYHIGDTLAVDVTTITAKDSAGWEALLREMNVSEIIISKQRESIKNGTVGVHIYYCRKGHPEEKVLISNCQNFSIVTDSPRDKTVFIFDINDIEQGKIIIGEKISELIQTNLWNNQSK